MTAAPTIHDIRREDERRALAIDARDCACGGIIAIVGHPMTERRITLAVQGHQAGYRHQSWIRLGGIEAMGEDADVHVDDDHEVAIIAATLPAISTLPALRRVG